MKVVAQIVGGQHAEILVRQKSDAPLELGELVVAEEAGGIIVLQVFDLLYGSQIQPEALQWASGLQLEENTKEGFLEENFWLHLEGSNLLGNLRRRKRKPSDAGRTILQENPKTPLGFNGFYPVSERVYQDLSTRWIRHGKGVAVSVRFNSQAVVLALLQILAERIGYRKIRHAGIP